MKAANIAAMATRAAAFDTETHKIQPGLLAPPVVCGSWATPAGVADMGLTPVTREVFREILASDRIMVGANISFDLLVMATDAARNCNEDLFPAIFAALEEERVFDILIAEQLHAIAQGTLGRDPRTGGPIMRVNRDTGKLEQAWYALDTVADFVLGRKCAKVNDEYRERYAELDGVPLEQWPEIARLYPVDDARNTLEIGLAQAGHAPRVSVGSHWGSDDVPDTPTMTRPSRNLHDLANQLYTAFAMHLGAAWGFCIDAPAVEVLAQGAEEARKRGLGRFVDAGIIRADGSQDKGRTKAIVARSFGAAGQCETCAGTGKVPGTRGPKFPIQCKACDATGLLLDSAPVPRTDKGGVSTARDTLAESGDELLMDFAHYTEDAKILSTYVPWLRTGIGQPLTLRPNVLLETGRTSYAGVVQLLPRSGGVRERVVARPGFSLGSIDYEAGELVTHGQSCIWICGGSKLAEALNAGVKVHNLFASKIAGITYEDYQARFKKDKALANYRQAAKPVNFGLPGGMGAAKLVLQQRKQGPDTACPEGPTVLADGSRGYKGLRFCILLGAERCGDTKVTEWGKPNYYTGEIPEIPPTCKRCLEVAEDLRALWFQTWPENREYFDYVKRVIEPAGEVVQHVSKRVRGGVTFTSGANGYFQGLLADAAKSALRRVQRECCDRTLKSPLLGSRVILFAHDELIPELRRSQEHEAAVRTSVIMKEELIRYCPDMVPAIDAPPTLTLRWYKGAEPVYRDGRLVPSKPGKDDKGKPIWVEDLDGRLEGV